MYTLKFNNTDLSFVNDIYVVNWLGAGVTDILSTIELVNDGSLITKSRMPERQVIINIRVFNEKQKEKIYEIFPTRQESVLTYIGENDEAKQIKCQVAKVEPQNSAFPIDIQVALLCPSPYWESVTSNTEVITGTADLLEFPIELPKESTLEFATTKTGSSVIFDYGGNIATGFKITITTISELSFVKVINMYTGEYLEIKRNIPADSEIIVLTELNNKKILLRESGETEYEDISQYVTWGSKFFKIQQGKNRFLIETSMGTAGITAILTYSMKYGGV